jgi:hypothetical protein
MNVLYYYYFLFYTKVVKEDDPHLTVIFTLSVSESFFVIYAIDTLNVYLFCEAFFLSSRFYMVVLALLLMVLNYLFLYRTGKGKIIVQQQPKYFGNNKISIFLVSLFFITTSSSILWLTYILKDVLDNC